MALPLVLAVVSVAIVVRIRVLPRTILTVKPAAGADQKLAAIVDSATFLAEDGQRYVYVDDPDSYTFLRAARNILRTGSPCDNATGPCRDEMTLAPVGTLMIYGQTLHVRAIVALHRLLSWVHQGWPLSESAFYVSVIMGGLGALLAFALGWRMGGPAGAVAASLLASLQKVVLERSLGGDNDIWNLVLPMAVVAALMEALRREDRRAQIGLAAAGALVCGLHANAWRGWIYSWAIAVLALSFTAAWRGAYFALHRKKDRPALRRAALDGLLVLGTFVLLAWPAVALGGGKNTFLGFPVDDTLPMVEELKNLAIPFPDMFQTVRELKLPRLARAPDATGGPMIFFAAILGGWLVALPERPRLRHWIMVACGAGAWLLVTAADLTQTRPLVVGLIAAPVAALMIDRLFDEAPSDVAAGFFLSLWWTAALVASLGAGRFLLLLAPPAGLLFAVTCGRVQRLLVDLVRRFPATAHPLVRHGPRLATLAVIGAIVLLGPVSTAYTLARSRLPRFNSTWHRVLEKLRQTSAPDAIVHAWWDYGYWVKYFADRRATADGGTLNAHVHHWYARALSTESEDEALGLLRMLDCGSDATPLLGGERSAFARLYAATKDGFKTYDTLMELVRLDRAGAERLLAERGVTGPSAERVLESTHCKPPEAYMTMTNEQAVLLGWLQVARFDPRRAFAMRGVDRNEPAAAVAKLQEVAHITAEAATDLDRRAREAAKRPEDKRRFATGDRPLLTENWLPCRQVSAGSTKLVCRPGAKNPVVERVEIDAAEPTHVRISTYESGEGGAASVMTFENGKVEERAVERPRFADLTVIFDARNRRVVVGTTSILRSVFARLLYFGGAGLTHFQKIDEGGTWSGERVFAYRVIW